MQYLPKRNRNHRGFCTSHLRKLLAANLVYKLRMDLPKMRQCVRPFYNRVLQMQQSI